VSSHVSLETSRNLFISLVQALDNETTFRRGILAVLTVAAIPRNHDFK